LWSPVSLFILLPPLLILTQSDKSLLSGNRKKLQALQT
jgi:hypothetical protein